MMDAASCSTYFNFGRSDSSLQEFLSLSKNETERTEEEVEEATNKIYLNFTHKESHSKREKCKAFWRYVESKPDLKGLKVEGWNEKDQQSRRSIDDILLRPDDSLSDAGLSEPLPPTEFQDRLRLYEQVGLVDAEILEECKHKKTCPIPAEHLVYADMVDESPEEVKAQLREFMRRVAEQEARRGNQPIMMYRPMEPRYPDTSDVAFRREFKEAEEEDENS